MLEDIINFVVVYKDVFVGEYYEGKKPETIIMIEEVKNKKKITRTYNITTGKETCFRVDAFLKIDVPWCTKGKCAIEKARLEKKAKHLS